MVKIGTKFFAPEWFDFDREEKTMENRKVPTYDEVLAQSIAEEWDFVPTRCPHCGDGAVSYADEDRHGNRYYHVQNCWCDKCGREWSEEFE